MKSALWLLLLLLVVTPAWGAGQRTHVEMGRRALDRYAQEVEAMLPGFKEVFAEPEALAAYYAGCMFPDWGFGKINDQAAEDAHWKRFQDVYFEYLLKNCPQPWDANARKRIAFFHGIVCHGMTDLPWHFSKEGHPSLLAKSLENDNAGHTQTEFAYDLFLYQDGTPATNLIPKLWWPMDDIRAVYRLYGTPIPTGQLENSLNRTHAMINGGSVGASFTASALKRKYDWVRDHVEDYYFGGVDHGGALTASWLKYYHARFQGIRFYQPLPTSVTENNDGRVYAGATDASIRSTDPKHNTGNEPFLDITGNGPNDPRAAYLRFDLADWDQNQPIAKAVLWLYHAEWAGDTPTSPKRLSLRAVTSPWTEGVGATSDVTGWKGQPHPDASLRWDNAARASTNESAHLMIDPSQPAGRWLSWDVTPLAQDWLKNPSQNQGVRIDDASSPGPGVVRVYSSEAFRTKEDGYGGGNRITYRPILILFPK